MNATPPDDERPRRATLGIARILPFGAPAVAVFAYVLSMLVGRLFWGSRHPSAVSFGAAMAIFGFAPVLGGIGLVAAIRGIMAQRRPRLMLVAAVLNVALIVGPYVALARR